MVLKFGGTSVESAPRFETLAEILRDRISQGMRPLVVGSALSQVSNQLEALLERALAGEDLAKALDELAARHANLAGDLAISLPDPASRTHPAGASSRRCASG